MAPRKRKASEEEKPVMPTATPSRVTRSTTVGRMTRSMSKQGKAKLVVPPLRAVRKRKKAETRKKRKNAQPEEKPEVPEDENAEEDETEKEKGTEDPETEDKADDSENENEEEGDKTKKRSGADDTDVSAAKTIIIEHGKQDASFKKKAAEVKSRLEQDVSGINVILNPEKPRKGCFEIREDGGETFISLLDIKRPFNPIKDLVIDKVISDILGKING